MSRAWSKGSTRRWRKLRAAVLNSNRITHGGRCRLALLALCEGTATEVHHAMGKAAGDDRRYLVPCCGACNRHIGEPSSHDPRCRVCTASKKRVDPSPRVMTSW